LFLPPEPAGEGREIPTPEPARPRSSSASFLEDSNVPKRERALATAEEKRLVALDIMTERFDRAGTG